MKFGNGNLSCLCTTKETISHSQSTTIHISIVTFHACQLMEFTLVNSFVSPRPATCILILERKKNKPFVFQQTWDCVIWIEFVIKPSYCSLSDCRVIKTSILHYSTTAHSHNSFPSGIAVEPNEQQALTYLNRERKVFWAGICLFPSSYPARYFRNEGFSLTGKEIELPWQPRPQNLLYTSTLVLTSVWLKASTDLEKKNFSQNCVLGRYGTGCGFPIRNFEGQKIVKVSQFAIAINTLTRLRPTDYTSSFTRLNWPFITRVPGVYLWLFLLSFFFFFFSEAKLAHAHLALARFS